MLLPKWWTVRGSNSVRRLACRVLSQRYQHTAQNEFAPAKPGRFRLRDRTLTRIAFLLAFLQPCGNSGAGVIDPPADLGDRRPTAKYLPSVERFRANLQLGG